MVTQWTPARSAHGDRGAGISVLLVLILILLFPAALDTGALASPGPDAPVPFPAELARMPFQEVKVRLVLLQATVTDRRGRTINDLSPEDFSIAEQGVNQNITVFGRAADHPLEVAFLLDISGSMSVRGKLDRARAGIRRFVSALRPEDLTSLLVFADGEVAVTVPFTADRQRFLAALDEQEPWGQTAVRDALVYASGVLAESRPGRKALILVTDGVDNASEMTAFAAIRMARRVQVPIYALGLTGLPESMRRGVARRQPQRSFLEVLADVSEETGGQAFPVFDDEDVVKAVDAVQNRLRHQYVLGYNPSESAPEDEYRSIEVMAGAGRYEVRTRRGYYLIP